MNSLNGYKVLLVDDSREINDFNAGHLRDEGYAVSAAETGAAALAELDAGRFDCVVLDVQLPDMDGYTLCRRIKEQYGTPVLFLSGLDGGEDIQNGKLAGCDGYMTKPHTLSELAWRINTLVRR